MSEYTREQFDRDFRKSELGYEGEVFLPIFGKPTEFLIEDSAISGKHLQTITDLLKMDPFDLQSIKALLLFDYLFTCSHCDWGNKRGRDNPFKINSIDDAFHHSKLESVSISRPQRFIGRWAIVSYSTVWEEEHGTHLSIRNGIVQGRAPDHDLPLMADWVR